MKFRVKNKETGKYVSPRNYYLVLKQNGELWTINHDLSFTKADDKYEVVIERQESTEHSDSTEQKALHIADVVRSFPIKAKHKSFGDVEIVGVIIDDATYHQVRYYTKINNKFVWVYDYDILWTY